MNKSYEYMYISGTYRHTVQPYLLLLLGTFLLFLLRTWSGAARACITMSPMVNPSQTQHMAIAVWPLPSNPHS